MTTGTGRAHAREEKMHTGHFYFAKNRTFLLCVDIFSSFSCNMPFVVVIINRMRERQGMGEWPSGAPALRRTPIGCFEKAE